MTMSASLKENKGHIDMTSYDVVKCLAIILMVVDHVGAFFFPQMTELRMVGRLSAPIWLILVGYANTRDIPPAFYIGSTILIIVGLVAGGSIFPLNVLVSIMFIRLLIDRLAITALVDYSAVFKLFVTFAVLALPLNILMDYGSVAFLFALYGFMLRHTSEGINSKTLRVTFACGLVIFYAAYEGFVFRFNGTETALVLVGVAAVVAMMSFFRPHVFGGVSKSVPPFITSPICWLGRHSLEFYVVHLAIFKLLATYLHTEKVMWFHPVLFPWDKL